MAMEYQKSEEHELQGAYSQSRSTDGHSGDRAEDLMHEAKEKALYAKNRFVEETGHRARSMFEGQRDRVAEQIEGMSQAFRQTGDSLRDHDQKMIAEYADTVADQMDRVTGYLRNKDMKDFMNDAEQFVRRQPVLLFGGALALGFLMGRFLKSSQRASVSREGERASIPGRTVISEESPYEM